MRKETEAKNNIEIKEETGMNNTTEVKEATIKAEEATKEMKDAEKRAVNKSVETKKKTTGKQSKIEGKKQNKITAEQTPSSDAGETVTTDVILPVIKDIEAVQGDVINYNSKDIERFKEACKQIHRAQDSMQKSYLDIAIPIFNVSSNRWFEITGDSDIYNFAKRVFGISRGRCSEFKKVVTTFGVIDEETNCCTGIKPEFLKYSASQLIEMSKMDKDQQKLVSETTSVSAMKKLRLSGELPDAPSENTSAPKPKKKNYQLFKGENLESYESLEKFLLSRLSEFTDQHEAIRNIKITLSYEE